MEALRDWIRSSNGVVFCPAPYLEADVLRLHLIPFLESFLRYLRRPRYYAVLLPSVYALCDVLREMAEYDNAIKVIEIVLQVNPSNAHAWNELALLALANDDIQVANNASLESIRLANHPNSWITLSDVHLRNYDYKRAIEACRTAITIDPSRAALWVRLGRVLSQSGKPEEAISAGYKALELGRKDVYAYITLAVSLEQAGRVQEAIQIGERAVSIDESSAVSWQTLARSYQRVGRSSEALMAALHATDSDPTNAKAWEIRARLLEAQGRLDEALQMLYRAAELAPDDSDVQTSLGVGLSRAGKHREALEALKRATHSGSQSGRCMEGSMYYGDRVERYSRQLSLRSQE